MTQIEITKWKPKLWSKAPIIPNYSQLLICCPISMILRAFWTEAQKLEFDYYNFSCIIFNIRLRKKFDWKYKKPHTLIIIIIKFKHFGQIVWTKSVIITSGSDCYIWYQSRTSQSVRVKYYLGRSATPCVWWEPPLEPEKTTSTISSLSGISNLYV